MHESTNLTNFESPIPTSHIVLINMQNEKPITTATTTTTDFSSKTLHQRYVKQTHTNKDEKRDIKVKSQTSKMPKHEGINTRTKLKYHEHKHQI